MSCTRIISIASLSFAGVVAFAGGARAQAPDSPPADKSADKSKAKMEDESQKKSEDKSQGTSDGKSEEEKGDGKTKDQTMAAKHVVESEVHFNFDSAELSAEAKSELDEAVKWIADNQAGLIIIEGHADKVGGAPYNKELGARRAENTRAYLESHGVTADHIRVLSFGEALPAEDTEGPSRVNRRITLLAVQKLPTPPAPPAPPPIEKKVYVDRTVEVQVPAKRHMLGFDIMAGGGVTTFLDDHTNDRTDAGGMWTARVIGFTHSLIGFEAAYVGSTQNLEAFGLDANASLMGNGLEGNVRLNMIRGSVIQPFVYAGAGWTHYQVSNSDIQTSSLRDDADDVFSLPAGVGVAFRFPRFTFDLRGTYRGAFGDTMLKNSDNDTQGQSSGLESVAGTAQLGVAF